MAQWGWAGGMPADKAVDAFRCGTGPAGLGASRDCALLPGRQATHAQALRRSLQRISMAGH